MDKKHENRKKDNKDPVEPKPEKNEAEEELVPEETVTLKQDEFQQVRDHITKLEGECGKLTNSMHFSCGNHEIFRCIMLKN